MAHFHWIIDGLFVSTVALIWFMLGYQSLLFFLGHVYYRRTRHNAKKLPNIPDADLPRISVMVSLCSWLIKLMAGSASLWFG